MSKKIFTLILLITSLVTVSNLSVAAQARFSDENQVASKQIESKPATLRDVLAKAKEARPPSDREVIEAMAALDKQNRKAPAKKLSTNTKVLIGIGIAAAVIGIVLGTYFNNEK
ncbi:hypothetical protein BH10ACI2_BH10ACI2_17170 [soil metagenome]